MNNLPEILGLCPFDNFRCILCLYIFGYIVCTPYNYILSMLTCVCLSQICVYWLVAGKNPLRVACVGGHVTCVECLIKHNAEVNLVDMEGRTLVYILALENSPKCLPVIVHAGAGK